MNDEESGSRGVKRRRAEDENAAKTKAPVVSRLGMSMNTRDKSTLSRPFRSPLKSDQNAPNVLSSDRGQLLDTKNSVSSTTPLHASAQTVAGQSLADRVEHRRLSRQSTGNLTPSLSSSSTFRDLQRQISAVRADVESLTQATALLNGTNKRSASLPDLVEKWRNTARAVAEELFIVTRDQINKMGGIRVWRDRERQRAERLMKWNSTSGEQEESSASTDMSSNEEDDSDEELDESKDGTHDQHSKSAVSKKEAKAMRREMHLEVREAKREAKAQRNARKEELEAELQAEGALTVPTAAQKLAASVNIPSSEAADEDEFTMHTMLRMLKVDLGLIGYDAHSRRWVS